MTDKATRDKIVSSYEAAMQASIDAQQDANKAKAEIMAFDEEHPQVMREFHDEKGKAKVAERGSTGTKVDAEGHASLAPAQAEGG